MKANPIWARQVALTRLVMAYVNSLGNFMIFYSAKHLSPHDQLCRMGKGGGTAHEVSLNMFPIVMRLRTLDVGTARLWWWW